MIWGSRGERCGRRPHSKLDWPPGICLRCDLQKVRAPSLGSRAGSVGLVTLIPSFWCLLRGGGAAAGLPARRHVQPPESRASPRPASLARHTRRQQQLRVVEWSLELHLETPCHGGPRELHGPSAAQRAPASVCNTAPPTDMAAHSRPSRSKHRPATVPAPSTRCTRAKGTALPKHAGKIPCTGACAPGIRLKGLLAHVHRGGGPVGPRGLILPAPPGSSDVWPLRKQRPRAHPPAWAAA